MSRRRDLSVLAGALALLGGVIGLYFGVLHVSHPLIVGFTLLLVVLAAAATARLWVPATVSIVAMLAFNYFFLAPVGTFYLADPQNWVALFVFLVVSLVASNLSTSARRRAREAVAREVELARLFDVSRDALSPPDSSDALVGLAGSIAERFSLADAAICLQESGRSNVHAAHEIIAARADALWRFGLANASRRQPSLIDIDGCEMQYVPLRLKTDRIGGLALVGRRVDGRMLDALAGVVALAIERAQFLDERNAAELARRSEELKSTLLASISHDLRTPLTAIRVAAGNLRASWLEERERREQGDVIVAEVERLQRLFQNIVEMARIDAGAVAPVLQWVHPSEIVEAARDLVQPAHRHHRLDVQCGSEVIVQVDPRLTASALAHVLENAAQYSPAGTTITLEVEVSSGGLSVRVRDRGPGIEPADVPHLFERFYRGAEAKQRTTGTGMGLAIARGLLAAERGRISVKNALDGGAEFTIVVPAASRVAAETGVES